MDPRQRFTMVSLLVAVLFAVAAMPAAGSSCSNVSDGDRRDCKIGNEAGCASQGCCWQPVSPNPANLPWCFHPVGGGPAPRPAPAPSPTPPRPPPPPTPPGKLPGCEVFHTNQCQGDETDTPATFAANIWYTPGKGEAAYQASFQDYSRLVAHVQVAYSDTTLSSAALEVMARHKDPSVTLTYILGGRAQASSKAMFTKEQSEPLTIEVKGSDGSSIELDPVDFWWNVPDVKVRPGDYRGGQKGGIVELFGWPHKDVQEECKDLAEMGYLGAKVFPVMEQVMATEPFQDMINPWYFMYQPVSYRLQGRMGTRDDLRNMIRACRSLGVRIYADAVINHMSGGGNDANPSHRNPQAGCATWGNKTSSLRGGHSPYYTQNYAYTVNEHTHKEPLQEFPAVPYGPLDFHCERPLNSWTDPLTLNSGWLTGLTDLNTERDNVQSRIAAYLTDLIGIGFSGFRIDAAKHIKPDDLVAIFAKLRRNLGGAFPRDFFTWLEVILGGEADMLMCNGESGYNYGSYLAGKLADAGFTSDEVEQVKLWNSGYPKEVEKGLVDCQLTPAHTRRVVIQNDDHDQQNPGSSSRDMGDTGCVLIKGCAEETHRKFEVQLFTNPPGSSNNNDDFPIRTVLSSYYWGPGDLQGMPDGLSSCDLCTVNCGTCKGMPYQKAHDPTSKGYDTGAGQYTRVHRDQAIVNAMRSWMGLGAIHSTGETARSMTFV